MNDECKISEQDILSYHGVFKKFTRAEHLCSDLLIVLVVKLATHGLWIGEMYVCLLLRL